MREREIIKGMREREIKRNHEGFFPGVFFPQGLCNNLSLKGVPWVTVNFIEGF